MTKAAKPAADAFIEQLEKAITATLKDRKTSAKDRNAAIANGIKLAMIKARINPDGDAGEFFGSEK
jgi:hypothetical protein